MCAALDNRGTDEQDARDWPKTRPLLPITTSRQPSAFASSVANCVARFSVRSKTAGDSATNRIVSAAETIQARCQVEDHAVSIERAPSTPVSRRLDRRG